MGRLPIPREPHPPLALEPRGPTVLYTGPSCFIDDLLLSMEQHLRDVRKVLSILRQEKPYVKASRCAFGRAAAAPLLLRPRPSTPVRIGCGGRGPAGRSGPDLYSALLYSSWPVVAGRGLAARANPAPLPAGPVHPRRRLPDADRRLRGRGRHAPRSGHLLVRLSGSLVLADPGRPRALRLSRRRDGVTVTGLP